LGSAPFVRARFNTPFFHGVHVVLGSGREKTPFGETLFPAAASRASNAESDGEKRL
jgi:hypothetical protein